MAEECRLPLETNKEEILHLGKSRKKKNAGRYVKWLGVIFDDSLDFEMYWKARISKARKVLGALSGLGASLHCDMGSVVTVGWWVTNLSKDSRISKKSTELASAVVRGFNFGDITCAYVEHAPFPWEVMRMLSGVQIPDIISYMGEEVSSINSDEEPVSEMEEGVSAEYTRVKG